MRAVNLLPSESKQTDTRTGGSAGGGALTTRRVAIAGGAAAVAVCGIVGFGFVGAHGDVAKQRDALDAIQGQISVAQAKSASQAHDQQQQAATTALPSDIQGQLDTFNVVAAARVQWDLLLSDVSRALPSGSWLSTVALQSASPSTVPTDTSSTSTPTTPTAPTGFVASGYAVSQPVVARLLQQLALVPMLSDITLQRSDRTAIGTDEAFQFTLSANVRLEGQS